MTNKLARHEFPKLASMPSAPWFAPDVPPRIWQALPQMRRLLGITDWYVWVFCDPALDKINALYQVGLNAAQLQVHLAVNPTLNMADQTWQRGLLHECLHIALAPYAAMATHCLARLDKPARKLGQALLDDAEEQLIERITRGLGAALVAFPDDAATAAQAALDQASFAAAYPMPAAPQAAPVAPCGPAASV